MSASQPRCCAQCGRHLPVWKLCLAIPSRYRRWRVKCPYCGTCNGLPSSAPQLILVVSALATIFAGRAMSKHFMGTGFDLHDFSIDPVQKLAAWAGMACLFLLLNGLLMYAYLGFGKLQAMVETDHPPA